MLAFSTLGVTGFVNQPFLPISRPDVPLGVLLRQSGPPTKRMVPCLCTSGRVGGRIGARSEWLKPTDRSKERVKRFGRVQKALAVLIFLRWFLQLPASPPFLREDDSRCTYSSVPRRVD
jgi:hypothetical protein